MGDNTDEAHTFGTWLKAQRKSRRLTQAELGSQIACSADYVRKMEADERRPSSHVAEILAGIFDIPRAQHTAFVEWARRTEVGSGSHPWPAPETATNRAASEASPGSPGASEPLSSFTPPRLPIPPTTFVGRASDVAAICEMLLGDEVALITMTGPGGVGKTRLALGVTREIGHAFPDGVWFVPLSAIQDPDLVPEQIARVLDLRAPRPDSIVAYLGRELRDKRALLVLDNFEQVLAAAQTVAALMHEADGLRILVTSRRPLRVSGEHEFPISPLGLPGTGVTGTEPLRAAPSVQLFVDRARAIRPDFTLTPATAPVVASICARLDGLPLAIELAAVQVRVFSLPALLGRLERGLPILPAGEQDRPLRQRTMQATVMWSYDLLTPPARCLFERLAAFEGGCTLEAMLAVCGGQSTTGDRWPSAHRPATDDSELLAALGELIESSLVQLRDDPGHEARYGMLETIRAYALERSVASEDEPTLREAHARYFLGLMQSAEPHLRNDQTWLARLDDDQPNLRAALRWALAHGEVEAAAQAASSIWPFWAWRGSMSEGRRWLEEILGQSANLRVPLRARVLHALGTVARSQLDLPAAEIYLAEGLELSRSIGDTMGIERALNNLGIAALSGGNYSLAQARLEEGLALARQLGNTWLASFPLSNLGLVAWAKGEYLPARSYLEEALQLKRSFREMEGVAGNLRSLSTVLASLGMYAEADAAATESLNMLKTLGNTWGITIWMLRRAEALGAAVEWERAARLWGSAQAQLIRIGTSMEVPDQSEYAHARATAAAHGREAAWLAAEAVGRQETLDTALELAVKPILPPPLAVEAPGENRAIRTAPDGLTERETQVLRLVSAGLTNSEIAAELVLSRRTVQAHLYAIYQKIGVNSRHGAAHYARLHDLA